jgi:hypothetical protein
VNIMNRLSELDERVAQAPAPVRARAEMLIAQLDRLLSQAEDDQAWAGQIGPAYTTTQVARLLGVSKQAVAKRRGLLRLEQRDGRTVYPVFQFDGDRPLPGIETVVSTLTEQVATPWTTASWLTSPQPMFDGLSPLDLLHKGDVAPVVEAAGRFAAGLAR